MGERIELKANLAARIMLWLFAALIAAPIFIPAMPLGGRIALAAFVALFAFLAVIVGARRLTIDSDGITTKGLFGQKHLDWNAVDHYTFWSQDQAYAVAAGGQAGLIGIAVFLLVRRMARAHRARKGQLETHRSFAMGAMKLFSADGTKLVIDQRYRKPGDALERAFNEVHARLRARPSLDFSPFQMGAGELVCGPKGALAFPDIEKIVAAGPSLVVHKRGKRFAFSRTAMRKIKNSLLLIELLGERGLIVNPSPGMFVPMTVLEKLRAATARQSAMPAARVVSR